jgi:hypothetical protein
MSRNRKRVPAPAPRRKRWIKVLVVVVLLLTVAALLVKRTPWAAGRLRAPRVTVSGTVLDTRVVVDHTSDSRQGGLVFYRIEAHVRYEFQGQTQDRWLTASNATTARELLDAIIAKQPPNCLVFWTPNHPENAKCLLE